MLMRIVDRSGGGAGAGAGCTIGGGGGSGGGAVGSDVSVLAQAAICSVSSIRKLLAKSVTETNTHNVYFGRPEPAACDIQRVKIIDRADIDTKVVTIIHSCSLHP